MKAGDIVKLFRYGNSKHGVPGRLLRLLPGNRAEVLPRNHHQPEIVPLDRVHAWKSGDRTPKPGEKDK